MSGGVRGRYAALAALASAALTVTGCGDSAPGGPTVLDRPRVLAIVASSPVVAPTGSTGLIAVAVDSQGRPAQVQPRWRACTPWIPNLAPSACTGDAAMALSSEASGAASVQVSEVFARFGDPTVLPPDAPCAPAQVSIPIIAEVEVEGTVLVVRKDLVVRFGAQTRANPGLTEMLFNGMPAQDYVLGSEYALSAMLDLSVADRVCIADDPNVTRVEPVTVYAYASAGDLADPSFEIAAPPEDGAAVLSGAVSWTAPRAGELGSGSVELWLVATDQDGGIAVVHRSLTAR
jgi:hypothetical protein